MVSRVAKNIIKKYGKAIEKAKTLNSETVKKLVLNLLESGSLVDERSAVFFLIAFLIFGRFEVPRPCKVQFRLTSLEILGLAKLLE